MESEYKGSSNGVERSKEREVAVAKAGYVGVCDLILRVIGFTLTLAAAVVIVLDKQTKIVPIQFIESLPPLNVPVTAQWHHMSAIVYFLVANAIACIYAALTLVIGVVNRGKSKGLWAFIAVLDAFMVALLFSGNGAAAAVGVLGYQGNSHVNWKKVCNVFERFCGQMAACIGVSLFGSLAFLLLVVIPVVRLHRKT